MRNLLLEAKSRVGVRKPGSLGQYVLVSEDAGGSTSFSIRLFTFTKVAKRVAKIRFLLTDDKGKPFPSVGDQVSEIKDRRASADYSLDKTSTYASGDFYIYTYEEEGKGPVDSASYRDAVKFSLSDGVKSVFINEQERPRPEIGDGEGDKRSESPSGSASAGRAKPELPGDEPAKKAEKGKKSAAPAKTKAKGEGGGAKDVTKIPRTDRMRGGDPHVGGTPEGWQNIITLDDPEGDRTGQKYGEPRYRSKEQGGLGIGDYVGPKFRYEAFIDPSVIKTQKDLVDSNKKSVYFRVSEDNFDQTADQTPKSSRDFNFTGLEVWSDGTWSGTKPSGISDANLSNLRFTFEELWNALKGKAGETTLPPGDEPPAAPPADTPSKEGGGEKDSPGKTPKDDDTVEGGGINATLGDRGCCHKPDKLFYNCYSDDYLTRGFPNGLDSSDEDDFYAPKEEYGGSVNRFRRGIEKQGSGWKHFIYTMQDKVEVYTEGNNLLDYNSPRTISKIRIRLGNGSYRDSASDSNGIAVLLPILRRIILDVRIFLPQRDDCGIPDDRIPAITNFTRWTSGGMNESYDLEIRNRVRKILQGSYRS